jgi:hypothetical protein
MEIISNFFNKVSSYNYKTGFPKKTNEQDLQKTY